MRFYATYSQLQTPLTPSDNPHSNSYSTPIIISKQACGAAPYNGSDSPSTVAGDS